MSTVSGKISDWIKKNFPFFLPVFLLLCHHPSAAQIDIRRYTTATDTFYWKRYTQIPCPPAFNLKRVTAGRASKKITEFLLRQKEDFQQYNTDSTANLPVEEIKRCLYPVDIDGDDKSDMIFSGSVRGEEPMVRIWLGRGDSFRLVFEDYQYISRLILTGGKLSELQTAEKGSGEEKDYLYFTNDYRIQWEKGDPLFVRGNRVVSYQHTEEPFHYLPHPAPFESVKDTMMLRASAARQDEPFIPALGSFGNIIAKYRNKARGLALAKKTFGGGNDWYFVEIAPSVMPSASILYDIDRLPTFIRGWVSGQAIELK